jgi:hypothetical protein
VDIGSNAHRQAAKISRASSLRKVAPGGAPDGQSEFCHQHARADIAKATADGVGIYDMRTTTVKKL